MSKYEEFRKQQELLTAVRSKPKVHMAIDQALVSELLSVQPDYKRKEDLHVSFTQTKQLVNAEAISGRLDELASSFDRNRIQEHIQNVREECEQMVTNTCGLGGIAAAYDRTGGNVDTIHNVRNEVYATEKELSKYESRGEYDSNSVHSHENYKNNNAKIFEARKSTGIKDAYTGKTLTRHDSVHQDHVISAKLVHDDPGRVLAGIDTQVAANNSKNLIATHGSINTSKGSKNPEKFVSYLDDGRSKRQTEIKKLQSKKILSQKEGKKLNKLQQLESVKTENILLKGEVARECLDRSYNQAYYSNSKFLNAVVKESSKEGFKMGAQQAVGTLLIELMAGIFDEIKDAFKNGLMGETLMKSINRRLRRLAKRLKSKWKSLIVGFAGGFLSGLISGIITTVINVFKTTGRRVIRLIREGSFTLLRALRAVFLRPKGTTCRQAFHEASKLIATGGIVIAGIAVEDVIEKLVMSVPILVPIAPAVSVAMVALMSSALMSLAFYLIDKVDMFGVVGKERDEFILSSLDLSIIEKNSDCKNLIGKIEKRMA